MHFKAIVFKKSPLTPLGIESYRLIRGDYVYPFEKWFSLKYSPFEKGGWRGILRLIIPVFMIMSIFLLSSCTPDKQSGVQSGQGQEGKQLSETGKPGDESGKASYSLTLRPQTAFRDTVFSVLAGNFKTGDASIQWMVNGETVPDSEDVKFKSENLKKGDAVRAKAVIDKTVVESNTVTVNNSPTLITDVKLLPETFKPGDTLFVEVEGSDPDGDEITYSYEWTKNGQPAGSGKNIDAPVKKGDKVFVKITPFDGEDYGRTVVMKWGIMNTPPMIMEDQTFNFDGKVYSFQVRASDPDEDPLTFSLKSAPSGMKINPETGAVTWDVPPDFLGDVQVTVAVTDGVRGETTREITISIKQPETEKKK